MVRVDKRFVWLTVVVQQLVQPGYDVRVLRALGAPLTGSVGHLTFGSVTGPVQKAPDPSSIVVMVQNTLTFDRQVYGLLADGAALTLLDPQPPLVGFHLASGELDTPPR